jgi:hypothetical protein
MMSHDLVDWDPLAAPPCTALYCSRLCCARSVCVRVAVSGVRGARQSPCTRAPARDCHRPGARPSPPSYVLILHAHLEHLECGRWPRRIPGVSRPRPLSVCVIGNKLDLSPCGLGLCSRPNLPSRPPSRAISRPAANLGTAAVRACAGVFGTACACPAAGRSGKRTMRCGRSPVVARV